MQEFIEFLKKYGVIGLAIAVIIGGKLNDLVNAVVKELLMPFIGLLIPGGDWRELAVTVGDTRFGVGPVLAAAVDFLIVAFFVYLVSQKLLKQSAKAAVIGAGLFASGVSQTSIVYASEAQGGRLVSQVKDIRGLASESLGTALKEASEVAAKAEAEPTKKRIFEGTAEINSVVTNGNANNQTTGGGLNLFIKPEDWILNLKSRYQNTIAEQTQTAELFEAQGRAIRRLAGKVDAFAESLYFKNRFAGFDDRIISSAGVGYNWLQSDSQSLRTEVAAGYTHEDRTDQTQAAFGSGIVGLTYKWKITETSDFNHETRYLPNFRDGDDWRLMTENSVSSAISSIFSTKISWRYDHVNKPPVGKIKGDTTTLVSILAKF